MNQTRYQRQTFHALPKEKRSIAIFGADTLSNRRFKCWNCGFVVDSERSRTGDGVGFKATDVVDPGVLQSGSGDKRDMTLAVDTKTDIYLSSVDSCSNPIPTVGNFSQNVFAGCPSCGSLNYK